MSEVTGGRELIAVLDKAQRTAPAETERVVAKGAVNIKQDWRDRWKGHPRIARLPYTIGYDLTADWHTVAAEIGPDLDQGGQAALAHIIEFGLPDTPPIPGGLPALAAEAPRFEKALADMATNLLGG
ncbi:MAG TPA: hypothetical protein VIQ30_08545 [Pseudonocardia sp.]